MIAGPDTDTRELGRAEWSHTPGNPGRPLVLALETTPQGGILSLKTDNGDNAAIELGNFEASYPVTRAVFKASGTSAAPVRLCYGNPEATFPAYELRLISSEL